MSLLYKIILVVILLTILFVLSLFYVVDKTELTFDEFISPSFLPADEGISFNDSSCLEFNSNPDYDRGYYGHNGKVYFYNDEQKSVPVTGSDINTFVCLKGGKDFNNPYLSSYYAKDSSWVYYFDKRLEKADPDTFEILDEGGVYAKDKNHVFVRGVIDDRYDVDTFEFISRFLSHHYFDLDKGLYYEYVKDKQGLYVNGELIPGSDYYSLDVKYSPYVMDSDNVYFKDFILEDSDPATFEKIGTVDYSGSSHYSKDKNNVYFNGKVVSGAVPDNFMAAFWDEEDYYGYDGSNIYKDGKLISDEKYKILGNYVVIGDRVANDQKIKISDPDSLEYIDFNYIKDKNYVYAIRNYINEDFPIFDPETFKIIKVNDDWDHYVLDKDDVYFVHYGYSMTPLIYGDIKASPDNFIMLGSFYSADGINVYFRHEFIEDLDVSNFSLVKIDDLIFGTDSDDVYYGSWNLEGLDPNNIKVKNGDPSKQAKIIYSGDVKYYLRGGCHGFYFEKEDKMLEYLNSHDSVEWDETRYLEEYGYC